jgi:hypothetical protein
MKRLVLLSLLFFLAIACDRKEKSFMPEQLLNEQEMINLMTDVQIIEADINYQKTQEHEQDPNDTIKIIPKDYVKMSKDYYTQLFEHYGITDSIFEQNLKYYTERPAELEKIMDSVMQRLTKEQTISSTQ